MIIELYIILFLLNIAHWCVTIRILEIVERSASALLSRNILLFGQWVW